MKKLCKKILGDKLYNILGGGKRYVIRQCKYMKFILFTCRSPEILEMDEYIQKYHPVNSRKEFIRLRKTLYKARVIDGFLYDEFFNWHVDKLSAKGKKIAASCRNRVNLEDRLNTNQDLYNNKMKTYQFFKPFYQREMVLISNAEDKDKFERFMKTYEEIIVKPVDSNRGNGIFILNSADKNNSFDKLLLKYPRGFVLEEVLHNVKEIAEFHPNSLNTIRLHTYVNESGNVSIFLGIFKLGRGKGVIDNEHGGGIVQNIDIDTGIVLSSKFYTDKDDIIHPDSMKQIVGYKVPLWEEAKSFVKTLALKDNENRFVAWDIALTEKGWCMIEGNAHGDFFSSLSDPFVMYDRMQQLMN